MLIVCYLCILPVNDKSKFSIGAHAVLDCDMHYGSTDSEWMVKYGMFSSKTMLIIFR